MAYSVLSRPEVDREFASAVAHVAIDLDSPQAAQSLLDAYDKVLCVLAEWPLSYPGARNLRQNVDGCVRRAKVRGYTLYFTVDETNALVYLQAFLHSSWDASRTVGERL